MARTKTKQREPEIAVVHVEDGDPLLPGTDTNCPDGRHHAYGQCVGMNAEWPGCIRCGRRRDGRPIGWRPPPPPAPVGEQTNPFMLGHPGALQIVEVPPGLAAAEAAAEDLRGRLERLPAQLDEAMLRADTEALIQVKRDEAVLPDLVRGAESRALRLRQAWLEETREAWRQHMAPLLEEADDLDARVRRMQEEAGQRREALLELNGRIGVASAELAEVGAQLRALMPPRRVLTQGEIVLGAPLSRMTEG